jgi:hypothetical protein
MTQKEFELQMQRLNSEYTKKSNEIARKKDEENAWKQNALLQADDAFHAEKRKRLSKITEIRTKKAALFDGDPKRALLEAEARNLEAEISVMRDDNERRKHAISHEAYANRRALDEQSRQISEWLNAEKLKVMAAYAMDTQ